jgi:hypothetical protein
MSAISFIDLNINMAEQFKESVSEPSPNTKIYLTFGRVDAWSNESSPDTANSSVATVYEVWNNMIGGKRLISSDIAHVIPRFNWTANSVYTAYDDLRTDLHTGNNQFYVVTTDKNVYKCIANNYGGASTVEPSSLNDSIVSSTSDGYSWKYMYTISDADQLRFMTTSYIPVKTLSLNDGSTQWGVQNNAVEGAIHYIAITNSGNNYSNANTITISISGDGSDASATATINSISNTINSIVILNPGSGYSYANVAVTSTVGANANLRAIISPPGGHGSDPLYELGGRYVMVNARLRYDESGVLPVTNDFRQIALIKDPILKGTSNTSVNSAILQTTTVTTVGVGDYTQDEYVYQGASLAAASFKGRVVNWDSSTGKVLLINTQGDITASQSLIGSTSFTVRVVSSVTDEALQKYSGRLLYVDNIKPITRATDQIEDFKILIKF